MPPSLRRFGLVCSPPNPRTGRFVPHASGALHPEYAAAWSLRRRHAGQHDRSRHGPRPFRRRLHARRAASSASPSSATSRFPTTKSARRYFNRTRSARGTARRHPRAGSWPRPAGSSPPTTTGSDHIIRCLYRPFDWRYVFWHPAMIDWPRHEVTRHLLDASAMTKNQASRSKQIQNPKSKIQNLCLIARRQQLADAALHVLLGQRLPGPRRRDPQRQPRQRVAVSALPVGG